MKPVSSGEVENIALLWEPVHIFDMEKNEVVGSVIRDVSLPNQLVGFSEHNRIKLREIFKQACDIGCRSVGFIAPAFLHDTVMTAALRVAYENEIEWQVDELERDKYPDLVNKARLKLLSEASIEYDRSEIEAQLAEVEKEMFDMIGLDTEALVGLFGVLPEDEQTLQEIKAAIATKN